MDCNQDEIYKKAKEVVDSLSEILRVNYDIKRIDTKIKDDGLDILIEKDGNEAILKFNLEYLGTIE